MEIGYLQEIIRRNKSEEHCGVYSCCSANYYVIKAVLKKANELVKKGDAKGALINAADALKG